MLSILAIALIFSCYLFVTSTLSYLNKESYFLVNLSSSDFIQLISFMCLWVLATFILFVWISNEIDRARQYKPDEFIPNLIRSLQIQGYVNITINDDIQLPDGNHLVKIKIQDKEHYFITQFDGKRIIRTLKADDFNNFFSHNNQSQK
jgi:hypothetical protein